METWPFSWARLRIESENGPSKSLGKMVRISIRMFKGRKYPSIRLHVLPLPYDESCFFFAYHNKHRVEFVGTIEMDRKYIPGLLSPN